METTSALGGILLHEASMEAGQLVGATSGTSYWDISKLLLRIYIFYGKHLCPVEPENHKVATFLGFTSFGLKGTFSLHFWYIESVELQFL